MKRILAPMLLLLATGGALAQPERLQKQSIIGAMRRSLEAQYGK